MINSADEYKRLRESDKEEECDRVVYEEAPIEVWKDIINRFPDAREWVAHNKTVPLEILSILSKDDNPEVRYMVAMKRKLSKELFDLLSKDKDESVRMRIACNAKTPREILEKMKEDEVIEIVNWVTERLENFDYK